MDFLASELVALAGVIFIDLVLAGDNAIVVGMAAAGLPPEQRKRAVIIGIAAAAGLRIVFALFTVQLLQIIGLMLAGGLLLIWVCWKLLREILAESARRKVALAAVDGPDLAVEAAAGPGGVPEKTLRQAITQIVVADVSMSLDNVLAVAGTARDHYWVLVVGLVLSVALMGVAASFVARLLHRYHWISYVGLVIIFIVAIKMIYDGGHQIYEFTYPPPAETTVPVAG